MESSRTILEQLQSRFSEAIFTEQKTRDDILTLWIPLDQVKQILKYLKFEIYKPFTFLYDLTAVDERTRNRSTNHVPQADFTLVYHL
ncbi:MAG: nuoC, partial [Adhaeribacter sp.]|nr:nuoC [Adhaeribacter sp.]